jgi:hypothetical protein
MKIPLWTILLVLLAGLIVACVANKPSPTPDPMINPGDKIGEFLITKGEQSNVQYITLVHCPYTETTETCEFPVGTKVNVSNSIFDSNPADDKNLEKIWSEHTYEMVIEGRPVNLPAFGSIDNYHPAIGNLRNWNVVVVSDKPGKITIDWSGIADGDNMKGTFIVIFRAPQ